MTRMTNRSGRAANRSLSGHDLLPGLFRLLVGASAALAAWGLLFACTDPLPADPPNEPPLCGGQSGDEDEDCCEGEDCCEEGGGEDGALPDGACPAPTPEPIYLRFGAVIQKTPRLRMPGPTFSWMQRGTYNSHSSGSTHLGASLSAAWAT